MPDGSRIVHARNARDPAALAEVYRAHSAYAWRVLRHCGVPDADLDDAVQETFLVVFRRLAEFEARASLRTWIYAIAVRVASTRRRSQQREVARREAVGEQLLGSAPVDPEHALSQADAAALIDRLLDELDDTKRVVFVLAELEGVKVPEISRILGVNPRTVHSRLRLARASFGSALRRERAREQGSRRVARLRPRALLEHAANDRPSPRRRKAAWAALAIRIEQGASPTLPGWQSLSLGGGAGAWVVPAAVLGALGVATIAFVTAPRPAPRTSERGASVDLGAGHHHDGRAEPSPMPTPSSARLDPPAASEPAPALAPEPALPPAPAPDSSADHVAALERRHSYRPAPYRPAPYRPALDRPASDHSASDRPAPSAVPPQETAAADASTLAAETRLLEQARSALRRGDVDEALVALDAHASAFPRGILLHEAHATRLRALCAAGRPDDASALAERLAPGQPTSRWHQVVAATCR
ncbi:RNA polymerase sigma factor [Paraliomyxa miuraensis]|uniref:RNA polymerase sigma factor n=1 Tax=Paraliomyxa miuraensis TaxID=376150 RepID=UPI002258FA98|nr:RNA polymerase sigma factor [Paraliomyxa miuraensis]MCX4243834.1 RNA polymerase sigma factor [Paraliomyxa miuraensis]